VPGLVGASAEGEVPVQAVDLEDLAPLHGRPQLLALASHGEPGAPRRTVFRFTVDDERRAFHTAISAPRAVDDAVRLVELEGVARSWRPLAGAR
jgi:hypothetical protein